MRWNSTDFKFLGSIVSYSHLRPSFNKMKYKTLLTGFGNGLFNGALLKLKVNKNVVVI